jgi:hypothetical protein
VVWSQPGQIVYKTLCGKKPITKKGWWNGSRCRPWVQTLIPQKQNKNKNNKKKKPRRER